MTVTSEKKRGRGCLGPFCGGRLGSWKRIERLASPIRKPFLPTRARHDREKND